MRQLQSKLSLLAGCLSDLKRFLLLVLLLLRYTALRAVIISALQCACRCRQNCAKPSNSNFSSG
jgi:hypothetical protein